MLAPALARVLVLVALSCAIQESAAQLGGKPLLDQGLRALSRELQKVYSSINQEIGDPVASDPGQCAVVPVGEKACGGPSGYVVYSLRVSDPVRMKALADRSTELEDRRNRVGRLASDCAIAPMPRAVITDGRCRASFEHRFIPLDSKP